MHSAWGRHGRGWRLLVGLAAVFGVVSLVGIISVDSGETAQQTLEVELRASAGTVAQLFWNDESQFTNEHSSRIFLRPASEGFQRLRFPLPAVGSRWIRLDPSDAPGEILIGGIHLVDARNRVIASLDPALFRPFSDIASIAARGDYTRVVTTPDGDDPALVATLACVQPGFADHFRRVTPRSLWVMSLALVALLLASVAFVGRSAFRPEPGTGLAGVQSPRMAGVWLAALFLVVFAGKLLFLRSNPVTSPYWDQWDGEARFLFAPFSECGLSWADMFSFHNEHRIFFTRVLALDLLTLNGQWDPRLEQVVNAAMHALTAVLLALTFWFASGRRRLNLLVLVCGLVFAAPFAWENTLAGFQSSFYFLILFSVLAVWLTTRDEPVSLAWCLGWMCATAALFTSAGGLLTVPAVLVVIGLQVIAEPTTWRRSLINLVPATAVLMLGLATMSPPIAGHAPLKAHDLAQFREAFMQNLAWPWIGSPGFAAFIWLPLLLLVAGALSRRGRTTMVERLALGVGALVVLNAATLAYARGGGSSLPATRYMDFLSLSLVANSMALVSLADRMERPVSRRFVQAGLAVWLAFAVIGVDRVTAESLDEMGNWRQFFANHATNVRRFVISGNRAEFVAKPAMTELPYPDGGALARLLEHPFIRRTLAAALREPLHVEARPASNSTFVAEGPLVRRLSRDPLSRVWSPGGLGRSAPATFESEPLKCQLGQRLEFEVAGASGGIERYFALKDLRTGEESPIGLPPLEREGWSDAVVSCPPGAFAIVAKDASSDSWFAFRDPVEVGSGSRIAESLIARSWPMLLIGLSLAILAARWS